MHYLISASEILCLGAASMIAVFVAVANLRPGVRLVLMPVFAGSVTTAAVLHGSDWHATADIFAGLFWMSLAVLAIWSAKWIQPGIRKSIPEYRHRHQRRSHHAVDVHR